jgi:predicted metal-dependent peptidase
MSATPTPGTPLNHEERIGTARAYVIQKAPYFSAIVYGFVYVPLEGIGTMLCTPTMILGYDPKWALEASIDELAADIAHETHHYIRQHFARAATWDDKYLFNLAGDLAINPQLVAEGWKLTEGAVFPKDYGLPEELSMEEYYDLLKEKQQEQQQEQQQKQQKQQKQQDDCNAQDDGQQPGQSGGQQKPGQGPPQPEQVQGTGPGGQPAKGVCQGNCGGMGGSSINAALEKQLDDTPELGRTQGEINGIEKRVANAIKEYTEKHGRGSVPGSLQDWATTFNDEPHIRWQDELAHILRDTTGQLQSGGDDFSFRRPSKRSLLRGFLRPGMVENLPEVAIIRDSSGSMGEKQLTDAAREAYGIMQGLGIDEVWFADADTEVAVPWARVGPQFFRDLKEVHGRGGTDFRQGIESALKLHPRPDLIVYVTDGDGTTTKMPPPDVAVVWAIVPSYYNKAPARWGHCVIISDDPNVRKKGATFGSDAEYVGGADPDDYK